MTPEKDGAKERYWEYWMWRGVGWQFMNSHDPRLYVGLGALAPCRDTSWRGKLRRWWFGIKKRFHAAVSRQEGAEK